MFRRSSIQINLIGLVAMFSSNAAIAQASPVTNFDVAGVKLGMTPAQSITVLKTGGFQIAGWSPTTQPSWDSKLSRLISERRPATKWLDKRVERSFVAGNSTGEDVTVSFTATPAGPVVDRIIYRASKSRMQEAPFWEMVRAKYGKPTREDYGELRYCIAPDGCGSLGLPKKAHLEAGRLLNAFTVTLEQGTDFGNEHAMEMQAALEAAAPKNAKPSF